MPYDGNRIAIENREMLCRGFCAVIASMPIEQLEPELVKLTQPIISCLNVTAKEAQMNSIQRAAILQRVANEIRLLACVVKGFACTDVSSRYDLLSSLLQKSWPGLTFVCDQFSDEEVCDTFT